MTFESGIDSYSDLVPTLDLSSLVFMLLIEVSTMDSALR